MKIEELDLDITTYNQLKRAGVNTVEDIKENSERVKLLAPRAYKKVTELTEDHEEHHIVTIRSFEIENVKRVKTVALTPSATGLTVIGGRNGQGKTSVLDSIAWALGGEKYRPTEPYREGSVTPPHLKVTLSNGIVVERTGKNSTLKVIDPQGRKSGQQLLNSFVEVLALDLPRFMNASSKEKANTLLRIIGVGDKLYILDNEEEKLYNQRHAIGQIADQKKKFAAEMPIYEGVPAEPVSPMELVRRQQDILAKNGENQRKRDRVVQLEREYNFKQEQIKEMKLKLSAAEIKLKELYNDLSTAKLSAEDLHDESTKELEASIADIDEINRKVRANLDREKAEIEAEDLRKQYEDLTKRIEDVRQERTTLLDSAQMPLEGLSVEKGELIFNGQRWDNMSGSEQLKVSTAIVRKLKPECGFVLLDKLEQMDVDTMNEFGKWCNAEGLQAIATRVSTGGECSIIIEDGHVAEKTDPVPVWKDGVF